MFIHPVSEGVGLYFDPQVFIASNVHSFGSGSFRWSGDEAGLRNFLQFCGAICMMLQYSTVSDSGTFWELHDELCTFVVSSINCSTFNFFTRHELIYHHFSADKKKKRIWNSIRDEHTQKEEISRALCNERIKNTQTEKLIQASPSTVNTAIADEEFFPMQQKKLQIPHPHIHTWQTRRDENKNRFDTARLCRALADFCFRWRSYTNKYDAILDSFGTCRLSQKLSSNASIALVRRLSLLSYISFAF